MAFFFGLIEFIICIIVLIVGKIRKWMQNRPTPEGYEFDYEKASKDFALGMSPLVYDIKKMSGAYDVTKKELQYRNKASRLNEFCKNTIKPEYLKFTPNYSKIWDEYKKQFDNNRDQNGNVVTLEAEAQEIFSKFQKYCLEHFHKELDKCEESLLGLEHPKYVLDERRKDMNQESIKYWQERIRYYEEAINQLHNELGITEKEDPYFIKRNEIPDLSYVDITKNKTSLDIYCTQMLTKNGFEKTFIQNLNTSVSIFTEKESRRCDIYIYLPKVTSTLEIGAKERTLWIAAYEIVNVFCRMDFGEMGVSFLDEVHNSKTKIVELSQYVSQYHIPLHNPTLHYAALCLHGELECFDQRCKMSVNFEIMDEKESEQHKISTGKIYENGRLIDSVATEVRVTDSENSTANMENSATQNFDSMEGHEFEKFCADILRKNGYVDVTVTQGSGDQGVDILANRDGVKYGIQCKCYTSDVGNKAVQEVYSGKAFYNCHVGVVLTNSYFTDSAVRLANNTGIVLWNRDRLLKMIETANKQENSTQQ